MATAGETIASPPTGERLVFRRTAADTDGALLEFDMFAAPGAHPGAPHAHLRQSESFEVVAGRIRLIMNGNEHTLGPGDKFMVPAGATHDWLNIGDSEAHIRAKVEPAGRFEELLETFYALAALGKTDDSGRPDLLQAAAVLHRHRDEYRVAVIPPLVQRLLFPLLAAVARLVGKPSRLAFPRGDRAAS